VIGVLALLAPGSWLLSSILFGIAGLVKETSVLSFAAMPWVANLQKKYARRIALSLLITFLPVTLWILYVYLRIPSGTSGINENLVLPFFGIANKISAAVYNLTTGITDSSLHQSAIFIFEVICPISLLVQALYLAAKPRISSATWRFGIGFVALLSILGENVWIEQFAYCRVLLPLTFAFNLLIHKHEEGKKFIGYYVMGNGGMSCLALYYLKPF
jgi:hypothetical protein